MADQLRQVASDRECQPFMIGGNCLTRAIRVNPNYWKDIRYWPDKVRPDYIGYNLKHNADTSKKTWFIVKITRSDTGKIVREQGPILGSWDGREKLKW